MLVLERATGSFCDEHFFDIGKYLKRGDVLVINDTKVIPARLIGMRLAKGPDGKIATGGGRFHEGGSKAEILLLKRRGEKTWESIVHPGKKLRVGDVVVFGGTGDAGEAYPLRATIREVLPDGNRIVEFDYEGIWEEVLDALGEMPLPPYITHELKDRGRYQTVYAKYEGSAAAPTAGLHFTKELLAQLEEAGVIIAPVTLHVGLGTFRPVKEEKILDHHMHSEWYQITEESARIINAAKEEGRRVIAVGTTSCRTIESASRDGRVVAGSGDTEIFIYPGYEFQIMDGLITNFHLPESTLLMLVSAFADRDTILKAYHHAIEERYRFFSFGDAMMII